MVQRVQVLTVASRLKRCRSSSSSRLTEGNLGVGRCELIAWMNAALKVTPRLQCIGLYLTSVRVKVIHIKYTLNRFTA